MNDKQLEFKSIRELFSSDDYVIPIYQRNYDWGESELSSMLLRRILMSLNLCRPSLLIGYLIYRNSLAYPLLSSLVLSSVSF